MSVRPLIGYYGGKQRIASWICQYIPKHTVYVEPFVGGAAVFFKKPKPKVTNTYSYREILNDKIDALMTLYEIASNEETSSEFYRTLSLIPYSRAIHDKVKTLDRNGYKNCSKLDIAVAFYINANMSFGAKINSGWKINVFSEVNPSTLNKKFKDLPKTLNRLRDVYLEKDNAINVIKRWDSPQTFFYCDPPYIGADQGHYSGYTKEDFEELINTLKNIKGSFLLSHYSTSDIEIPKDWEIFEKSTTCSAKARTGYDRSKKTDESDQNRKRTELLYRKLASEPREEIKKLYSTGNYDCFPGPGWEE
jgi:DNA adenine methylase